MKMMNDRYILEHYEVLLNNEKNFNPTDKRNPQKFHKKIMQDAKKVRRPRTFSPFLHYNALIRSSAATVFS